MFNWILKFFIKKQYTCCMELHNHLGCYLSLKLPSEGPIEGFREFFHENNFIISYKIFNPKIEESLQLEEIYDKICFVYDFNPREKNISIIRGKKKIYVPERKIYILLPSDGAFVYDKTKLRVFV